MIFTEASYEAIKEKYNTVLEINDYSTGIPNGVVIFSKQYQEYMVVMRSDAINTECVLLNKSPGWRGNKYTVATFKTPFLVGDDYKGSHKFFMCNFQFSGGPTFRQLTKIFVDHIGDNGLSVLLSLFPHWTPLEDNDIRNSVGVLEVNDKLITNVRDRKTEVLTEVVYAQTEKKRFRKATVVKHVTTVKEFFKKFGLVTFGMVGHE